MKCPQCSAEVTGRFCGHCGAGLEPRPCPACGVQVAVGHRFCGECGADTSPGSQPVAAPVRREPSGAPPRALWWGVGGLGAALLVLGIPYLWSDWASGGGGARVPVSPGGGFGGAPAAPGIGGPGSVDLSSMTPREAADRLFNRVMAALSAGNQGEVQQFLPMAIDAYRLVPGLDHDGYFHLSLLQQAGGDNAAALTSAQRILEDEPRHLLGLYAGAEAARSMGDEALAREYYQRLLDHFDAQSALEMPEYREHGGFLPTIRETAQGFLAGG